MRIRHLGALALIPAVSLTCAAVAEGAAYTKSADAPQKTGPKTLRGSADLNLDCSDTLGCHNYIKIDVQRWNGAKRRAGSWANNNGVNTIDGTLKKGCYNYRTTVDSYNDVVGAFGGGASIGKVGVTKNGEKVYRYKSTWSSGWTRICSG